VKRSVALVVSALIFTILVAGCIGQEPASEVGKTPPKTPKTPSPIPSQTPPPTPTPTPLPGITATPIVLPAFVETDKASYLPDEEMKITVTLQNSLADQITISPFPPEVIVEGEFGPLKVFPAGSKEVRLKPGQSISFNISLDLKESKATPGSYRIMLGIMKVESGIDRLIGFSRFGKSVVVRYPQGALSRTLELNLSEGDVILKKIEFSPEKSEFYVQTAMVVPEIEGAPLPLPTPPDDLVAYSAELVVDGEAYRIKPYGYKPNDNWMVIFVADPLPSDAKMLELVVRNFKSSGVWRFNVSLQ